MAMGRFLVPLLPLCAILFAFLAGAISSTRAGSAGAVAGCLLVIMLGTLPAFDLGPMPGRLSMPFRFRNHLKATQTELGYLEYMRANVSEWIVEGKMLADHAPEDATITAGGIGAIAYYSDLFVIDRCGLTNPKVAELDSLWLLLPGHDKCRPPDLFAEQKPDFLWSLMARDALDVRRVIAVTKSKHYSEEYVLEFVKAERPAGIRGKRYLVLCRRLAPGEDPEEAWARVEELFPHPGGKEAFPETNNCRARGN